MFENDSSQNDRKEEDDFFQDPYGEDPIEESPTTGDPLDGMEPGTGRLSWEELPKEEAKELEAQSETPMCEHDEDRQVITKQTGAGVQIAGMGSNVTQTVTKVVCPKCGGEWDTWDGSNQSTGQDPLNF